METAKTLYSDNKTAAAAFKAQLQQLAATMEINVETLLQNAHEAKNFLVQYRTALNLERRIHLLKS